MLLNLLMGATAGLINCLHRAFKNKMAMNNDHCRIIVPHSISVRAGNLELIMRINIRK